MTVPNGIERIARNELLAGVARVTQLIGIPFGLALLSFLLVNVVEMRADAARTREKFIAIDATFVERNNRIVGVEQELFGPNRYRRQDAERDFAERDRRVGDHEVRIRALENPR